MNQEKIGRFIAEMRKKEELTQSELADILGISNKTISKWECGNGMPELSLMKPICKVLKIDLNELFSGEKLTNTNYKKKAEENLMSLIQEAEEKQKNIVGEKVLGQAKNIDMDRNKVHKTNSEFWNTIGNELLGVISLPKWGEYLPLECKLQLLGDISNKKVLEIGCGNGCSLKYVHTLGASDLWGVDISEKQIEKAKAFLKSEGINSNLVCSPMEEDCNIPNDFFDVVYSVYGIGWTTDLDKTFLRIHSYLKENGSFIFSWSHPIHKCVSMENGKLLFSNSYFNEEWYCANMDSKEIMLSNRMLSTYINALAHNGFMIEKLVEETDKEYAMSSNDDFGKKALMVPTSFVIKARKI